MTTPNGSGPRPTDDELEARLRGAWDRSVAKAEELMALPSGDRELGIDSVSGNMIVAKTGRYGPYVTWNKESRSLPDEPSILTIDLPGALALLAQPKPRGRQAAAPGKEIGEDPATKAMITLKEGRFGPYVTDGETNASLRRADDPEKITLERASELLAERRAAGPPKKRAKKAAKKAPAKKAPAKKAPAKKAAAKKAPAKKAAAKA